MSGTIKEIEKGRSGKTRYRIVVEVGRDPLTGKRRRIVRYHEGKKKEAESLYANILTELSKGEFVEASKVTVAEWMDTWLTEYKKPELRPTTWDSYEVMVRVHIKPALGICPLKDLRPEHLQRLYNFKLEKGLSPTTVRYIHAVLHGALKQAVANKLIGRNVAETAKLPRQEPRRVSVLNREQEKAFREVIVGERIEAAFWLLLGTGIRRGELLGLEWRDVDLEKGILLIRRNLVRTSLGLVVQEPKTKSSARAIPMPQMVVEKLEYHKEKMLHEENYMVDKPVFCTVNGTHIYPRNFNRKFAALCKKAGIGHANVHGLRHTFATRLLEMGESMKVVQEMLGHSRIAVTADTYSHVSPELKRDAADKLDKFFRGEE